MKKVLRLVLCVMLFSTSVSVASWFNVHIDDAYMFIPCHIGSDVEIEGEDATWFYECAAYEIEPPEWPFDPSIPDWVIYTMFYQAAMCQCAHNYTDPNAINDPNAAEHGEILITSDPCVDDMANTAFAQRRTASPWGPYEVTPADDGWHDGYRYMCILLLEAAGIITDSHVWVQFE